MTVAIHELRWIPEAVANLMQRNNIRTRNELAKRIGIGVSTIYTAFDETWAGRATGNVLAQIAGEFGVPMATLVVEPGLRKSGQTSRRGSRS